MSVSGAVNWFFSHETEGIILEDDVLPVPTFFDFCDEMLERYRNNDRIAMISGCNLVSNHFKAKESYFFSRYNHVWGWATWRRAWRYYDLAMTGWPIWRDSGGLARISGGNRLFESYWRRTLDVAYAKQIDAWSYPWIFTCWRLGVLAIIPALNQTRNLGFGADATHTNGDPPKYLTASRAQPLSFPLIHPETIERECYADASIESKVFGINVMSTFRHHIRTNPVLRYITFPVKALLKSARR